MQLDIWIAEYGDRGKFTSLVNCTFYFIIVHQRKDETVAAAKQASDHPVLNGKLSISV